MNMHTKGFAEARKISKTDKDAAVIVSRVSANDNGCWNWTGYIDPGNGYGRIHQSNKKHYAHRRSYEVFKGPIPAGMNVLHTCDCKTCANPDHLYIGTQADNARDYIDRTEVWQRRGRLPAASVLAIVILRFEGGRSYNELSEMYHVSQQAVANICRGRTYSKLTGIESDKPAPKVSSKGATKLVDKAVKKVSQAKTKKRGKK